jgi:very-short-patch-repair endonuclease
MPDSPRSLARRLRRDATDAERRLWWCLRESLPGFKFRRQHPVGDWILDFYCPAARLAIEVDGGGHADPDVRRRDELRTSDLARRGIRVLRFWNTDVHENLDGVLEQIWRELTPSPRPSPPHGGEGEGP